MLTKGGKSRSVKRDTNLSREEAEKKQREKGDAG
jgi:hypothetical protein